MSLMDSIGRGIGELAGGAEQAKLVHAALDWINSSSIGGLSGLVQQFEKQGQGDKVRSWISHDENQSISAEQVQGVFGHERMQQLAQRAGMSEQDAAHGLAGLLPKLVDMLSPDGNLPKGSELSSVVSQLGSRTLKH